MNENQIPEPLQLQRNRNEGGSGYVDVKQDGKVFRFMLDQFAIEDYLITSPEGGDIWREGDSYLMTELESAAARRIFALAQEHLDPRKDGEQFTSYRISVEFLNQFPDLPGAPRL